MTSRTRSTIGALMMLAILPILAGLLACMPVPIGDPERSRIDPDINGVWVMQEEGEFAMYAFQPFDKRTWLITGAAIEAGPDFEADLPDSDSSDEYLRMLEDYNVGDNGITSTQTVAYKAWMTKIGGVRFMTWEPVGGFDDEGNFAAEVWFVFKIVKASADKFELYMVNIEHEGFEHLVLPEDYEGDDYVRDMRRKWERALKKIAKDDELYADPWIATRVPGEYLDAASELFQEAIAYGE